MSSYIHLVGKADDNRLSLQNKILWKIICQHLTSSGINNNSIIADIGCGNGDITCYLLDKVKKIYAIDNSDKQLELTKEKVDAIRNENSAAVEYIKMDIRFDEFPNDLDFIFVKFVLMHIENKYIENIFNKFHKSLNIGGRLIIEETIWNRMYLSAYPELEIYKQCVYDKMIGMDYNIGNKLCDLVSDFRV